MYSKGMAISRVQNRWPPRATAALDAFLNLSAEGQALGYDMQVRFDVCQCSVLWYIY